MYTNTYIYIYIYKKTNKAGAQPGRADSGRLSRVQV